MIGIGSGAIVGLMTTYAFPGCIRKITIDMAFRAIVYIMSLVKREKVMVKPGAFPFLGENCMTIEAFG
jgi:uncharacterized membrane protein (Fun14 family)